jgi:uncharacterized protein (TIGR02594 family)
MMSAGLFSSILFASLSLSPSILRRSDVMIADLLSTHQARLADLGYYTGTVDGVDGPLTQLAMVRFKEEHGFRGRPYPGPETLTKLWSIDAKPYAPPALNGSNPAWVQEAVRLIGTREKPGSGSNPVIMQWAKDMDQWYPDDATAWCGLFVAHCVRIGAPGDSQEFNRLSAQQWLQYGHECDPHLGCIIVFWRGSPDSWKGHVGFLVGEDQDTWHTLGGNQSNSVNVTRVSKHRTKGCRWPTSVLMTPAVSRPFPSVTTRSISRNEA